MDFKKYSTVVAEPPADAGRAAGGTSPLQGAIQETMKDGEWRGFLKVPTEIVAHRKKRGSEEKIPVREFETLCDELKRAARQLEVGLQLRVKQHEDGKSADVYFKAGEKRKYNRQSNDSKGGDSAGGDGASGNANSAPSAQAKPQK